MTSRERVMAVCKGEKADRKPVILMDGGDQSDVYVERQNGKNKLSQREDVLKIREVVNPLGRAIRHGFDLNGLLGADPEEGANELDRLCDEVRKECEDAAESGFDGILYRIVGAEPEHSTPMQYGGFYLERDRELLEEASDAAFNLLFVEGGEEAYFDFVSDLPANAFAWDIDASNVSVVQMRAMRKGALAAEDPTADILLARTFASVEPWIEKEATRNA
jgi:hypothetical protein